MRPKLDYFVESFFHYFLSKWSNLVCSKTNLAQDEENVVGCLFSKMGQDANDTGLHDGLQILETVTVQI